MVFFAEGQKLQAGVEWFFSDLSKRRNNSKIVNKGKRMISNAMYIGKH